MMAAIDRSPAAELVGEVALLRRFGAVNFRQALVAPSRRLHELKAGLGNLRDAFDDFEGLLEQYAREQPCGNGRSLTEDQMQFIAWLGRTRSFTSRQHDHIVYESSRLKVEQLARRRWSAHVQFQRTAARGESDGSFTGNPESPLHVNPIWVWSRFTTRALLGGSARVPANLMCFPTRVEIRGAVFELEGQALWNELIDDQPSDLREWAAITRIADAATLDRFSRSLVRTGLVAFG